MRLTCPNCGAQYEVPDDVIPDEGRDVQCSNCGDTWFQQAAGIAPDATADPDFAEPPAPEPAADAAPARTATEHPDHADQDTEVTFASEPQLDPSATSDSTAQDAAEVSPTEDSPQQTQDAAAEDRLSPPSRPPVGWIPLSARSCARKQSGKPACALRTKARHWRHSPTWGLMICLKTKRPSARARPKTAWPAFAAKIRASWPPRPAD